MSENMIRRTLARLLGTSHGGARDLYEVFGYPRTLTVEDFEQLRERNGVADRAMRAFPQATWRHAPIIRDEAGESEEDSAFRAAWEEFADKARVYHYLERLDRLSGVGQFGLMVMGFRDGLPMTEPLEARKAELLYLRPYSERAVTIASFDRDPLSPRFGLPLTYRIKTGTEQNSVTITVHHSRCLHVSEFLDDDEVFGTPRLKSCYNHLRDLEKIAGGAAECFWLAGNRGIAIEVDPAAEIDDATRKQMREEAEEYQHQLKRVMGLVGAKVHDLGSATPDPTGNIDAQLKLIAGATGIPQRILTGSEAGELASSQDEHNFSSRVDERKRGFVNFAILRPFVNAMIATGNLPAPRGQWWVDWPEVSSLSEEQRANIANLKSQALRNYTGTPGAEFVVPVEEFRVWLGEEAVSEYALPEEPEEVEEDDPEAVAQFEQQKAAGSVA